MCGGRVLLSGTQRRAESKRERDSVLERTPVTCLNKQHFCRGILIHQCPPPLRVQRTIKSSKKRGPTGSVRWTRGRKQVSKRSTHARPGMHMQQCPAVPLDHWYDTWGDGGRVGVLLDPPAPTWCTAACGSGGIRFPWSSAARNHHYLCPITSGEEGGGGIEAAGVYRVGLPGVRRCSWIGGWVGGGGRAGWTHCEREPTGLPLGTR